MAIKTVSLETAKLLKEAGFRQEDIYWHWLKMYSGSPIVLNSEQFLDYPTYAKDREHYAAPTTDELLEELPNCTIKKQGKYYSCWVHIGTRIEESERMNESLPEALSKMWLYLKKEGLLP